MALPVSPLQVRKQQFVREAIWDAAIDLFAVQGYDETTVEDIAAAAGVSRRSFFRYFASKSELMAHGLFSYGDDVAEAIVACPENAPLPEVLRETVLRVARKSAEQPRTRKILQIAAKYPAAREAQMAGVAELQHRVAAAFAQRREAAGDALLPGLLAGVTLSALSVTLRTWFEQGEGDIAATVALVFATLGRVLGDRSR